MNFQKSHRKYMCCFCGWDRDGEIAGHHLRCLQQGGTGKKPPEIFTIPVCKNHHDDCHDFTISKAEQVNAMCENWRKRGVELLGMQEYWRRVGEFYSGVLK